MLEDPGKGWGAQTEGGNVQEVIISEEGDPERGQLSPQ